MSMGSSDQSPATSASIHVGTDARITAADLQHAGVFGESGRVHQLICT